MAIGGFGGFLGNLGAIAGGAQQYQLRDAAYRQALAQLAAEQRRQQLFDLQLKEQQKAEQQAGRMFSILQSPEAQNLFGGGGQIPDLGGGGGAPDYSPGVIQAQPIPSSGAVNGQRAALPQVPSYGPSGGMPTNAQLELARQAIARGYPPAAAAGMAGSLTGESGRNLDPYALNPTSGAFGRAQWLGPRKAGLMQQPNPASQATQDRYMFSELRGPEAATGQRMMEETDPGQAAVDFTRGFERPGNVNMAPRIQAARAVYQQLSPQEQQQAAQTTQQIGSQLSPMLMGRIDVTKLAQLVQRQAGDAPDDVKMGIVAGLYNYLNPAGKAQLGQAIQLMNYQERVRHDKAMEGKERTGAGELVETDQGVFGIDKSTMTAKPVEGLPSGAHKLGTDKSAGTKPARFGTIEDLLQRWHEDFIAKNNREPTTDEIAQQRATLTKEGKPQSATQAGIVRRLEIGANDVARSATAITSLPFGTTLGIFGGAQGAMGPELLGNVKRALANAATPESAQVLRALTKGLGRGLAIIGSGGVAQGMVTLQKDLQELVPTANDTGLTIAGKFADMRQLFDAATEVMLADEQIPEAQHKLILEMQKKVHDAIPFETQDVAKLVGDPSDEKLADFARRVGLGQQAGGQSGMSDEDLKKALGLQ